MAVDAADFTLAGGGRLNPAWFDGQDLNALLATWITRAGGDGDELTTARVYFSAFTFLSDQIHADPASQRDRDKSDAYSADQLAYWAAQARRYQDEIDLLTGDVAGPEFAAWEGRKHDQRFC